jgi:lysophospholipase L1-like esterase
LKYKSLHSVPIITLPWDKRFVDDFSLSSYSTISLRQRINIRHLNNNLEWREDADGYQCSSHANFSFVTNSTLLVFEAVDYAHYGEMVTPLVLNDNDIILQLPPLSENEKTRLVPLSLPPGENKITVINSMQSNCSWGGIPKNYIVRSIFSDAPLYLIQSGESLKKRMVIYGDSIAAGGNADIPGINSWGTLLRQNYDIAFEASGWKRLLDDASKLPETVKSIASYQPEIVWLAIGVNDFQGPDPMNTDQFAKTYNDILNLLHEYLPNAVIIAQSPIVMANANDRNVVGHNLNDYRIAIKNAAADYPWCHYVNGANILKLSDLADGVHPNTAGMAKYANWVADYLDEIIASYCTQ